MSRATCPALLGAIIVLTAWLPGAAAARPVTSSYSSIAESHCRTLHVVKVEDTEYAASRVCVGRGGYKVFVAEDDLRETLTVGKTLAQAGKEPAARDRYGAFNGYEDKVEWRSGQDGRPFAIVVGWSFADNENVDGRPGSARLLVVMRLPPGAVCKVAYVDRAANADAEEIARKAADEIAPNFRCDTEKPRIIGKRGRAIQALTAGTDSDEDAPRP